MTMDKINYIVLILQGCVSLMTLSVFLLKPVRSKFLQAIKNKDEKDYRENIRDEATRCTLRNVITSFYYGRRKESFVYQYEYENLLKTYEAYKQLKGNSFIDTLWNEIKEWEIMP